jgi:hypothetical protein
MSMTTAQKALNYLRANGVPQTRAQVNSFCTAYVVADLCHDLADASPGVNRAEVEERLAVALQITVGAMA